MHAKNDVAALRLTTAGNGVRKTNCRAPWPPHVKTAGLEVTNSVRKGELARSENIELCP
jgi:hypothetical protein